MGLSAEVRRERRREKAAPYPRPRGPSPQGCTWDEQKGGWWKADGTEWQRKRIPEPGAPKGPAKWTIAFEEECAARKAREKAVRFDTALRCIAPSTSTRSKTRCAAPVPRGAGVTSGRRCGKLAMHWGLGSSGFCRRSTLQAGRGLIKTGVLDLVTDVPVLVTDCRNGCLDVSIGRCESA